MTGYYGKLKIIEIHYSKRFNKCLAVEQIKGENHISLVDPKELENMVKLPGEPSNLSEVFLDLIMNDFKDLKDVEFKYNSDSPNLIYLKGKKDDFVTLALIKVENTISVISYCDLDLSSVVRFLREYGDVEYFKSVVVTEKDNEKEENSDEKLEDVDSVEDPTGEQIDQDLETEKLDVDIEEPEAILPVEVSEIESLGVEEYMETL